MLLRLAGSWLIIFSIGAALAASEPHVSAASGRDGVKQAAKQEGKNAQKALDELEGVWRFAAVAVNGKGQPALPFETNKMILTKDGRSIVVQGPRTTRGSIKVDPSQSPMRYDVTVPEGSPRAQTFPGVYALVEGKTLKVCLPLDTKSRPSELVSKPDSGQISFVFERQNKDLAAALLEVAHQELAGTWQAVSYSLSGQKASEEEMKKIKLQITSEGETKALQDGKVFIASTTKLDPGKSPMTIDLTFTAGDPVGKTALGIYKIEGNLLTICRAGPGQPRPKEFSSKPESGHTLMTYRRDTPEKK